MKLIFKNLATLDSFYLKSIKIKREIWQRWEVDVTYLEENRKTEMRRSVSMADDEPSAVFGDDADDDAGWE